MSQPQKNSHQIQNNKRFNFTLKNRVNFKNNLVKFSFKHKKSTKMVT